MNHTQIILLARNRGTDRLLPRKSLNYSHAKRIVGENGNDINLFHFLHCLESKQIHQSLFALLNIFRKTIEIILVAMYPQQKLVFYCRPHSL